MQRNFETDQTDCRQSRAIQAGECGFISGRYILLLYPELLLSRFQSVIKIFAVLKKSDLRNTVVSFVGLIGLVLQYGWAKGEQVSFVFMPNIFVAIEYEGKVSLPCGD